MNESELIRARRRAKRRKFAVVDQQLRTALDELRVSYPKSDWGLELELIEHAEWGVALEQICSKIANDSMALSKHSYDLIEAAGTKMSLKPKTWESIKTLVRMT